MGAEERVAVRHGGKNWSAVALLETDDVIIRGEPRIRIPLREISSVSVEDGVLTLDHPAGPTRLELGAKAEKWAQKIRSPRSRLDKLGVKTGARVAVVGTVASDFLTELTERAGPLLTTRDRSLDLLFVAMNDRASLKKLATLKASLAPDGALWVVRPKGVDSISENDVLTEGKAAGLVDTKVVRFSETHTAEKFVIPIKAR
jgi:hypothetical protein